MRLFTLERLHRMFELAPPGTFWRHDVDVSPAAAVAMARFEQERGIRSTFYVMTTSPFYTAAEAVELAAAVSARGHRVGLHIDPRLPGEYPPVGSAVSWHCPPTDMLWRKFDGFESAYGPLWEGRYLSDSRGWFAHGDPEDRFAGEFLQVNLHPEWWFARGWERSVDPDVYAEFFHEPIAALATGGIVTRPVTLMFGDGSPEYVIPLGDAA